MNTKKLRLLGLIVLALAACLGSFAQSVSGDLAGTIFDASGATIPNATIVGKNDATGVETTTKSTATGEYHLSNLPPGTYTVTVAAAGFTKAQLRDVAVEVNPVQTGDIQRHMAGHHVRGRDHSRPGSIQDRTFHTDHPQYSPLV